MVLVVLLLDLELVAEIHNSHQLTSLMVEEAVVVEPLQPLVDQVVEVKMMMHQEVLLLIPLRVQNQAMRHFTVIMEGMHLDKVVVVEEELAL